MEERVKQKSNFSTGLSSQCCISIKTIICRKNREPFRKLAQLEEMIHLCSNSDQLKNCKIWLDIRKYSIFSTFSGFGYSSMNIAETGQSSNKWDHSLSLVSAAHKHIISVVIQSAVYDAFMADNAWSSSRRPTHQQSQRHTKQQQLRQTVISLKP